MHVLESYLGILPYSKKSISTEFHPSFPFDNQAMSIPSLSCRTIHFHWLWFVRGKMTVWTSRIHCYQCSGKWCACLQPWRTLVKHIMIWTQWRPDDWKNNESDYNYTCICYFVLNIVCQALWFDALQALFSLLLTTTQRARQCNPHCTD